MSKELLACDDIAHYTRDIGRIIAIFGRLGVVGHLWLVALEAHHMSLIHLSILRLVPLEVLSSSILAVVGWLFPLVPVAGGSGGLLRNHVDCWFVAVPRVHVDLEHLLLLPPLGRCEVDLYVIGYLLQFVWLRLIISLSKSLLCAHGWLLQEATLGTTHSSSGT